MEKWEYKVETKFFDEMSRTGIGTPLNETSLNQLGAQGWELVAVMVSSINGFSQGATYHFKRRKA